MEDLAATMERAQIPIDSDTMHTCFVTGLLESEHEQEIRDIGLMKNYVRPGGNRPACPQSPRDSEEGRTRKQRVVVRACAHLRRAWERPAWGRRTRQVRSGTLRTSVTQGGWQRWCSWRWCEGPRFGYLLEVPGQGTLHDNCTTKLCDRCGGRGHDIGSCPTPADEQEAHLAMCATISSRRRDCQPLPPLRAPLLLCLAARRARDPHAHGVTPLFSTAAARLYGRVPLAVTDLWC